MTSLCFAEPVLVESVIASVALKLEFKFSVVGAEILITNDALEGITAAGTVLNWSDVLSTNDAT